MPLGSWHVRVAAATSPWDAGHCVGTLCSQETLHWESTSLELRSWQRRSSCIDLPVGVVVDGTKMLPKVLSMNCSSSSALVGDFPRVLSFRGI